MAYKSFMQSIIKPFQPSSPATPVAPARQAQEVATPAPTPSVTTTYTDPAKHILDILGPSPEERRAQEERRQIGRNKIAGWLSFFDGLRALGQAAGVNAGAPYVKMADTAAKYKENAMADEALRRQQETDERAYKAKIYELEQKGKADALALADRRLRQQRDAANDARAEEKAEREKAKEKREAELHAEELRKKKAEADRKEKEADNLKKGKTASGGVPSQGKTGGGSKSTKPKDSVDAMNDEEVAAAYAKAVKEGKIEPVRTRRGAQVTPTQKRNALKEMRGTQGGSGSSGGGKKIHGGGKGKGGKKIHK